jgi:hypothetical protein
VIVFQAIFSPKCDVIAGFYESVKPGMISMYLHCKGNRFLTNHTKLYMYFISATKSYLI